MYINGRFLTQRITGVQRFAREIVLAAADHKYFNGQVTLLAPAQADLPQSFAGFPVQSKGQRAGHAWEQLELSRMAGDSLLINLCNTAPLLRKNQLVVLHDATVAALPQNFTFAFRTWYQVMIRTYGRRAGQLATVSRFSADEIVKYFGIPPSRIEIIPESGEHILRTAPDYSLHTQFSLEQDGYFLAVSSHAVTKNFDGVLKAVAKLPSLPFKFVIAGGRNDRIFGTAMGQATGAVELGYLSDAQLRALYERAACFVYPSFYEGFGLPPLEAMACGCPVLVSKTASMREVCGEGASYCDPYNIDDISAQLSRLLESRERRAELREAGLKRAAIWTWASAAKRLNEIIAGAHQ